MVSHHETQPLGRISRGVAAAASRPRFALGQTLRVIHKTARIPLGTEVRVTYWLPLRRDGTYHYFVTGPLTAMAREGAWVHERDLEAAASAPPPPLAPQTMAPENTAPVRMQLTLAALPQPPAAVKKTSAAHSSAIQNLILQCPRDSGPGSPKNAERRKLWFRDWLTRGHLR